MIDKQRYCSIVERFLAYKYRKENNILYSDDLTIPEQLVEDYFDLKKSYNLNDKEFIRKYVENELNFEEIDHCDKKLFEYEKYSEYAGEFRKAPAYLKGDPTNLVAWENIYREALYLNKRISVMHERAKKIKEEKETEEVLSFIYDTVNLSADMLLVHPFVDGNGRTVRALTNKLFIDAGIPPVYVTPKEKHEYIKALVNGRETNDYSELYGFYLYKICDSIVILDIDKEIEREHKLHKEDKKESVKRLVKVLKHRRDSISDCH